MRRMNQEQFKGAIRDIARDIKAHINSHCLLWKTSKLRTPQCKVKGGSSQNGGYILVSQYKIFVYFNAFFRNSS